MILDFNKFATEGNQFLIDLAKELGYPEDADRAARVLKSILHALRHQLTVEESVQFIAQLPMFLKAVYVQNWTLRVSKKPKHFKEFYQEIRAFDKQTAAVDFTSDDAIDNSIGVVFMALRKYISLGELEDIKSVLPKDLKTYVTNVTMI